MYQVFNYTDGIPASSKNFKTKKAAAEFIENFRKSFERQGYYFTNRQERIPPEAIDLEIIPHNFNPYAKPHKTAAATDTAKAIRYQLTITRTYETTLQVEAETIEEAVKKFEEIDVYAEELKQMNVTESRIIEATTK